MTSPTLSPLHSHSSQFKLSVTFTPKPSHSKPIQMPWSGAFSPTVPPRLEDSSFWKRKVKRSLWKGWNVSSLWVNPLQAWSCVPTRTGRRQRRWYRWTSGGGSGCSLDEHRKTIHKGKWYKIHGLYSRRVFDSLKAETEVKQQNLSSTVRTREFCFTGVFSWTQLFISSTSLEFLKLHSHPAIGFYVKPPLMGMGVSQGEQWPDMREGRGGIWDVWSVLVHS